MSILSRRASVTFFNILLCPVCIFTKTRDFRDKRLLFLAG